MTDISRRLFAAGALAGLASAAHAGPPARRAQLSDAVIAMRRATRFMTGRVAPRGAYVWTYLPDFSRRWGELEATPTMAWIAGSGTPAMGHAFLDAWNATGESAYLAAAEACADTLVAGQHASGGWNEVMDSAGPRPLKDWYETTGANAWRLEQFQHFADNATFDGGATADAALLLLRLVKSGRDGYRPALDRAIKLVRDAQYPVGGWPQRFPLASPADATAHVAFGGDVAEANIAFLIMCYRALGDESLLPVIRKAMDAYVAAHQPAPQAGWALYHAVADLKPAVGRSYEPAALSTQITAQNVARLMDFFEMTGDPAYLARVGEALDWLDTVKLPAEKVEGGKAYPVFIEVGTNQPLYVHRFGSNAVNGQYFVNHEAEDTIAHQPATCAIDATALRARLDGLKAMNAEDAKKASPLAMRNVPLPRFYTFARLRLSDLGGFEAAAAAEAPTEARVREIVAQLNGDGWWPTPLVDTSHPFCGPGAATPAAGDFSQSRVGDISDTSPFTTPNPPMGISTATFIRNMAALSAYVQNGPAPAPRRTWF